jgi:uncharacterized membrane protein YeaQ/YmgE (transglycosylase-associated protein family)
MLPGRALPRVGGETVLHWIAFVVIGLVVGALWGWAVGGPAKQPVVALIGGLVGSLIGGRALLMIMGRAGKYPSLLSAIVIAIVLAWVARAATGGKKAQA